MSCSCIQGLYNFDIEELDTGSFRYTDLSVWMTDPPYVVPEFYYVIIQTPLDKKYEIKVKALNSTIIEAKDLGMGNCLIDGIYCFSADECINCGRSGGKNYSKNYAILPRAACQISNLFAIEDDFDVIKDFDTKVKQIKAVSSIGNQKMASELYKVLNKELRRFNCKICDC